MRVNLIQMHRYVKCGLHNFVLKPPESAVALWGDIYVEAATTKHVQVTKANTSYLMWKVTWVQEARLLNWVDLVSGWA